MQMLIIILISKTHQPSLQLRTFFIEIFEYQFQIHTTTKAVSHEPLIGAGGDCALEPAKNPIKGSFSSILFYIVYCI